MYVAKKATAILPKNGESKIGRQGVNDGTVNYVFKMVQPANILFSINKKECSTMSQLPA
jgi:hypothetical protein